MSARAYGERIIPRTAIVQVFLHGVVLEKVAWRSAARANALRWPTPVVSRSGMVVDGSLHVHSHATPGIGLDGETAIVLNDRTLEVPSHVGAFPGEYGTSGARGLRFSTTSFGALLDLQVRGSADAMELWLERPTAEPMRAPKQERFPVAVLHPAQTVRIRRNHKADMSASSGQARTYTETDCVIQHLGFVSRVVTEREGWIPDPKRVPLEEAKEVDLRFELY